MVDAILLHHPSCGTSRKGKALLEEKGVAFIERRYLTKTGALSRAELEDIQRALGAEHPSVFARVKDVAKLDLVAETMAADALLDLMADNPKLIQRPILWKGDKAVLGRPPENLLNLE